MLMSILLALGVMLLIATIYKVMYGGGLFEERASTVAGQEPEKKFVGLKGLTVSQWGVAIIYGLVIGAINYFAPRLTGGWVWLAPLFFCAMVYSYFDLMQTWHNEGSEIKEFFLFALLAIIMVWPMKASAAVTTTLWNNMFWTSVVFLLPKLILVFTIGFLIVDALRFRYKEMYAEDMEDSENEAEEKAEKRTWCRLLAWLVGIFVFFILLAMIMQGVAWKSFKMPDLKAKPATVEEASETGEAQVEAEEANTKVSPEELEAEAVEQLTVTPVTVEELEQLTIDKYDSVSSFLLDSSLSPKDLSRTQSGFSDALTFGFESKEDAKRFVEVEVEILRNPVYGVTVANAIKDKKIGDKTIGSFNPWLQEMVDLNDQHGVSYWLEKDEEGTLYVTKEYRCYAATLCTWLERLVVQGVHAWPTVENWCLNMSVKNNDRAGVPASYQYAKDALILAYVGKNDADAEVGIGSNLFVIGFNIHDRRPEFYGGTPEEPAPSGPVTPEPESTPDNPTPTPTPKPDPEPDPKPDPDPKYDKDPEKAPKENTEPNDTPGPGPSTNNGPGATTSTADQPTNSDHYESPKDYMDDVNDLAETNKNQATGSSPNKPSTPKPTESTKVDNNGGDEINKPTSTTSPAAEVKNDSDNPADSNWGGPPD